VGDFVVRGSVKDPSGKPVTNVKVFALDSDQGLFEDYNDDLLGAAWVNQDGSFQITFSSDLFKESLIEGNVDIYFVVRNSNGEIIARTDPERGFDLQNNKRGFEIVVDSAEKKAGPIEDVFSRNIDRTISAFANIGDVATVANSDFARVFALLNRSINAWVVYTQENSWRKIRYDGPQVPARPRDLSHTHQLAWENRK
jgi:hypothetical protein